MELGSADVKLDHKRGSALFQRTGHRGRRVLLAGNCSGTAIGTALYRPRRRTAPHRSQGEAIVAYREALQINPNDALLRFPVRSLLLEA